MYRDDSEEDHTKLSAHYRKESQTLCLEELEVEKANSELTEMYWKQDMY